jgi:hypothetical protein
MNQRLKQKSNLECSEQKMEKCFPRFPQVYLLVLLCASLYFGVLLCTHPEEKSISETKKQIKTKKTISASENNFVSSNNLN